MNLETIEKAGLDLVSPIVDGRFVVMRDGGFFVARFDKKAKGGIKVLRTRHESLPNIGEPSDVRTIEPEPEPEPVASPSAAEQDSAGTVPAETTESAPAATESPAIEPETLTLADKLAIRGAIRAWMRNSQWRVGSHLYAGRRFIVSRPDSATYLARRWHVASVHAGVVVIGETAMESYHDAILYLIGEPRLMRLDGGLPSHPAVLTF